jgi:hypothetical protein
MNSNKNLSLNCYNGFAFNKLSEEIAFGLIEAPSFNIPIPVNTIFSPGCIPSEIK